MKLIVALAVLIGALVLACSTAAPAQVEPTPNIDATVEARAKEIVAAQATQTPYPTYTQAAMPTYTPNPTYTPYPTPTNTPTSTPAFTPTSTPELTPTLEPTPTPILTSVRGELSANTVWTKTNSPYILTGHIRVPQGVHLEIQPGVDIDFNGWFIQIDGLLRALGTSGEPINFSGFDPTGRGEDGNRLEFGPTATSWSDATGDGSIVQHATFNGNPDPALIVVNFSSPKLSFIEVNSNGGRGITLRGAALLENSRICGNMYGVVIFESSPTIRANEFCDNRDAGIYATSGEPAILQNIFKNNGSVHDRYGYSAGIRIDGGSPSLRFNLIEANVGNGVFIVGREGRENSENQIQFEQNSILGNSAYAVRLHDWEGDIDMANNWWGTNDRGEIDQLFYHQPVDFRLGEVTYFPFLLEPPQGVASNP